MKPKANGIMQRTQRLNRVQGEGPNWVLIAGGALLCTLSIRVWCRLKHAFDAKRSNNTHKALKENGKCVAQRRPGTCMLHSNLCCYTQEEDGCYHRVSENLNGDTKHTPTSPISKVGDHSLQLVKIPTPESKPFHRSNSSGSLSFSESGSDIYSKREVIQKLRQQLKRRDEMIMEMQAQITELQNSLSAQANHSAHLQSQLDSSNQDLFDSEREIQRLRKVIADHCVIEANGYLDDAEAKVSEKVEMLKREVGELKEVIEGKEFLLRSYKEQKIELSVKVKELQLKLSSQVLSIL